MSPHITMPVQTMGASDASDPWSKPLKWPDAWNSPDTKK
jgi:hypothetical protein